jgi:N-carbamoylputrescine amidase
MAGVMAGSFVASANRRSYDSDTFSGGSWLISPEAEVLAGTTADEPYVTVDIDPSDAESAKHSYPRNVYIERRLQ